ncbi:OLC1v1030223C1 [Oldenlandia corymbosa var. corymbosa]|uniref:OLC1v1030223C1 n=1 Tax=Oldenlandia corymbosa var. corymbosa TaxID=529605 RepID=A0AAV1CGK4_OLDCO|nr:OLC1v1030223C1 [Oldenlandia corymbosa var. corymbosa]
MHFEERFTVLSYNILADYLAAAHRQQLYFHIPGYMMDWEWRKRNIAFEIGLWSADILCLQEVDRFQDLKEELGLRGYSGIWKMRTGDPIDGCAIFWRDSRFKLLHEESIEFNRLGLRDNVAQICVLESLYLCNDSDAAVSAPSLKRGKRVVVCNIHVLFNPKRGDIKLGQVRVLLSRAHSVAKLWDDAPVVVCGDFNSTPKSPLYSFITEQKLDLSELPRNQVSGQTPAETRPWKPSNPHPGSLSAENSSQVSPTAIHELGTENSESVSVQKQDSAIDSSGNKTSGDATISISFSHVLREGVKSMNLGSEELDKQLRENDTEIVGGCNFENESTITASCNDLEDTPVALQDVAASSGSLFMDGNHDSRLLDVKTESCSSKEILEGRNGNDKPSFRPEEVESIEECASLEGQAVCPPESEMLNDIPDVDPDNLVVDQYKYDSSAWTPAEIEAATGSSCCMIAEHPLKLHSAYGEVQDCYGTRDSTGEPSVTSYHKRFFGTVDYIWRSEGLQTSRVLATLPKHAMMWTQGFPTKKWGSDHIALVSELAFRDNISCPTSEVKLEDGS